MPFKVGILITTLRKIFLKVVGEKLLTWTLFWVAEMIVQNTKTKHDDIFLAKVKEIYEEHGEGNGETNSE